MTGAILTVAEMRAAEQTAVAGGTSEWALMQRAGAGAAPYVARVAAGRQVTVLCGPGNNGGDGYVIAQTLKRHGVPVAVVAPWEPRTSSARQARMLYNGPVTEDCGSQGGAVLVDALFGHGLSRALDASSAALIGRLRAVHPYRIAIDLPSGVDADTGALPSSDCVQDLTIALGAWKRAHVLMPARGKMGALRLVDLGLDLADGSARMSTLPRLREPPPSAHKYTRGMVAVIAGAMCGAALLSAEAALRAGAGYVKLTGTVPAGLPPEIVVSADPEGVLDDKRVGAALVGPGLGTDAIAREKLGVVLERSMPTVLDADALRLLDPDALEGCDPARLLVTPHDGELAALCDAFGVRARDKWGRALGLHEATGMVVLAKGPDTLLVGGGGPILAFPRASSWLSVAGSGDVLAGIAASRLAGHGDPRLAAEEAVWLHHEAARRAGPAFTAGDLARAVAPALRTLL